MALIGGWCVSVMLIGGCHMLVMLIGGCYVSVMLIGHAVGDADWWMGAMDW